MKGSITTGQDAFLDIVANLVGILIILVVLVGAQARSNASNPPEPDDALVEQVTAANIAADEAAARMKVLVKDNEDLTEVRHRRLVVMEELKQKLAAKQAELDVQDQALLKQQSEKIALQRKLQELTDTTAAVSNLKTNASDAKTINHYPNPIARTVFSQEVHFRLQYELESVPTARARRKIRFKRFSLYPVVEDAGEPVAVALSNPASEFYSILKNYNPAQTTVSIWVYPDSFVDHGVVKKWLYENNFKMASWPLDFGRLISGGPDGLKTSAQ